MTIMEKTTFKKLIVLIPAYNEEELIGKTITVQYFEETKNQEGGISLRFPTVKHVFENGRNV